MKARDAACIAQADRKADTAEADKAVPLGVDEAAGGHDTCPFFRTIIQALLPGTAA